MGQSLCSQVQYRANLVVSFFVSGGQGGLCRMDTQRTDSSVWHASASFAACSRHASLAPPASPPPLVSGELHVVTLLPPAGINSEAKRSKARPLTTGQFMLSITRSTVCSVVPCSRYSFCAVVLVRV